MVLAGGDCIGRIPHQLLLLLDLNSIFGSGEWASRRVALRGVSGGGLVGGHPWFWS